MDIEQTVLSKSKLSESEAETVRKQIEGFMRELKKRLEDLDADPVLGGSAAKGTYVKGDFDCDIFVRFNPKYENISDLLKKSLKGLPFETLHGSRDYFRITNSINFEIVPVLRVNDAALALNVTDMSPLHVEWIKRKLNHDMADQIIIAKKFCKSQLCYGAESYIGGFSGHVLDILIIYYGSFQRLLENAVHWEEHQLIDVENHHTTLNKSKLSPLLVIDPVDKNRNAAAALSPEKFNLFKLQAKKYLDKPDISFFEKKEFRISDIEKRADDNTLIALAATPLHGKDDVVGGKLMKVYDYIKRQLELNDFEIIDSGWNWDDIAEYWFILKPGLLSEMKTRIGPPLSATKQTEKFKSKHPDFHVENNRLYANVRRNYLDPRDLIKTLIKSDYVRQRVADIK